MNRDDGKAIGVSLAVHALLFLLLGVFWEQEAPPPPPLGMIEVELGAFERAAPAARSPEPAPPRPTPPRPEPDAPRSREQAAKPVRLPTPPAPSPEPEVVKTPRTETIQPTPREEPRAPAPDPQPPTGGTPTGTTGEAATEKPSTGAGQTERAPYSIEGLDRSPRRAPLPANPGQRGTVAYTICVAPDGRIVRQTPRIRAGAALDRAAADALRSWLFVPLPPAAPQVEQCGVITFRFTLG